MKRPRFWRVETLSVANRSFLIEILFLQSIVFITAILDIPIARQVTGFLYFTFVPGFVFVKLIRLEKLDVAETVLFSVGLSIVFLILSALFVNEVLPLFGFLRPLSFIPLMIFQSSLIIIGAIVAHVRGNNSRISKGGNLFNSFRALDLLFLSLPILSIVGAVTAESYQSNLLPLILIVLISLLFSIIVFRKKLVSPKLYPFVVFIIAISLLYQSSMISKNIVSYGSDVPVEYFVFKITQNSAHWNSSFPYGDFAYGRLNAMLSITILPTVYSSLLNLDPNLIFKMAFPALFALVPLCLYKLWENSLGKKGAFVAAFLFMALEVFYGEALGLSRQMIAELFFALLLLVIFSKKINSLGKIVSFGLFSISLVISHYALAEIFLFFLLATMLYSIARRKPSRNVTMSMVGLFCIFMFFWYLYTSNAAVFDSFTQFGDNVIRQLNQFFNPESRGEGVLIGLGLVAPPTIWNSIGRIFAYLTEAVIVIGFIGLITKQVGKSIRNEQFVFSTAAVGILVLTIAIPGLANTIGITRFYHILLFLLAALFVLGIRFLSKTAYRLGKGKIPKSVISVILLIILVPYFLFQSGFVYEITGNQSYSLALSRNRISPWFLRWHFGYFTESEITSALWLSKNLDAGNTEIYADSASRIPLIFNTYSGYIGTMYNYTKISQNSAVYLNQVNLVNGFGIGSNYLWNITSISPALDSLNIVYSNGGSEIYRK